jgi:FkbM family methyltransferase
MNDIADARLSSTGRGNYVSSLLLLQAQGFQVDTFIDVGAAEGIFFLLRHQEGVFPGARHFFIDAMHENEALYRGLAAKFGAGYEIAAISCMEGEAALRIDPNFYNTHIDHLQPGTAYADRRRVPMCTLDSVVARHALQAPFAVKLDVQGGELDVLRGALRTLEDASVVTAEIQIFPERDSIVELLSFMQGVGWALYDITNPGYYPSNQVFYQCYATFIPRDMDYRRGTQWCLPDQEVAVLEKIREARLRYVSMIEQLLRS